ncbi:MAG: hypothetical protein L0F95_03685 [Lactococcus sp.]|nr:hypothetical protein [Lactococcus sp.]MDN5403558.1 hypothetical protein [Lactococcus sp.]MDN5409463.1 hypothetical protein [Lactococcus sp.]MDN5411503.1 hypothetical protein [Lactococcus sp.]MDN5461191.1 hypothetical protein [Lactococcus sp.]MDN5492213.1 hypothetical protein [Lactococcus sp.]
MFITNTANGVIHCPTLPRNPSNGELSICIHTKLIKGHIIKLLINQ